MDKVFTKKIYCANCQDIFPHVLTASQDGEIVATCPNCGRFLKFPSTMTPSEFQDAVITQQEVNKDQVTVESIDKKLADFSDDESVSPPVDVPQV